MLQKEYKGADMKNAKFHNRLSDLIHSGFALDENNKETFEVMNELESSKDFGFGDKNSLTISGRNVVVFY